jgi:hypothetical protein
MNQRPINLNPGPMEAVKITYPANHSRRRAWLIEYMRFIPHEGSASYFCSRSGQSECVNNGEPDGR